MYKGLPAGREYAIVLNNYIISCNFIEIAWILDI